MATKKQQNRTKNKSARKTCQQEKGVFDTFFAREKSMPAAAFHRPQSGKENWSGWGKKKKFATKK